MSYQLLVFIVVGFIAQLVDGSIGMAYGVTSNTMLLGIGIPPAISSANFPFAKIFTTGVSGLSHLNFGKINK